MFLPTQSGCEYITHHIWPWHSYICLLLLLSTMIWLYQKFGCGCAKRMLEYAHYLRPPPFWGKRTYDKPMGVDYIQPMDGLFYFIYVASLFHIFLCLSIFCKDHQFRGGVDIHHLHDTCNMFSLSYSETDWHSHR